MAIFGSAVAAVSVIARAHAPRLEAGTEAILRSEHAQASSLGKAPVSDALRTCEGTQRNA